MGARSPREPTTPTRPRTPSKRALWDTTITQVLAGYYEPDEHGRRKPEALYGSLKMWAHLNREGIEVARCTVERLMRANGWQGVRRLKKVRTTVPDPAADGGDGPGRPAVHGPGAEPAARGRLHLRAPGRGCFSYTAFVIAAYAGRILGWECSTSKETRFVDSAIRQPRRSVPDRATRYWAMVRSPQTPQS